MALQSKSITGSGVEPTSLCYDIFAEVGDKFQKLDTFFLPLSILRLLKKTTPHNNKTWRTKIYKVQQLFCNWSIFIFEQDLCAPPNTNLLCANEVKKTKQNLSLLLTLFPNQNGCDFFDRLKASVPMTTEVEPDIFVISVNSGTGQSTSQIWNFSLVYRKNWYCEQSRHTFR